MEGESFAVERPTRGMGSNGTKANDKELPPIGTYVLQTHTLPTRSL